MYAENSIRSGSSTLGTATEMAQKEGEITTACFELAGEIDLLEGHLSKLVQRLAPVSVPEPPTTAADKNGVDLRYAAPLASNIDAASQRIRRLIEVISGASNRLELP